MQKIMTIAMVGLIALTCGCATKGRFSVIDLDLRTQEQIKAYENEADIVYVAPCVQIAEETSQPKVMEPFTWDILVKLIEVFKGRIRIISFEWLKVENCQVEENTEENGETK